jgi:hypothetical protein
LPVDGNSNSNSNNTTNNSQEAKGAMSEPEKSLNLYLCIIRSLTSPPTVSALLNQDGSHYQNLHQYLYWLPENRSRIMSRIRSRM